MAQETDALDALMDTSRLLVGVVVRSLSAVAPQLSVVQLRVLVLVDSAGSMTVNDVAAGLGVNASSASRTCERLVRAGLLERGERPDDRRHSVLSATGAGRRLVAGVMIRRRTELARLLDELSAGEAADLRRGLSALNRAATPEDAGADHHLLAWMT